MDTNANSWAKSIFAATLFVENLEETKQFYVKVFDLPLVFEDTNSVAFKIGDTLINLLKTTEPGELVEPAKVAERGAGSCFVSTIHIVHVDALYADLVSRGVELVNGPMDRPWGVCTASFMDPDGHIWEIAKYSIYGLDSETG